MKKEIIIISISALITVIVTVPITIIINNWNDRAKPILNIEKVVYANDSNNIIEIPNDLLLKEKQIRSYPFLTNYMKYEDLLEEENRIAEQIKELKYCSNVVENWLAEYNDIKEINYSEFIRTPIIEFKRLRESIIEMMFIYDDIDSSFKKDFDTIKNKEILIPFFVENNYIGLRFREYDDIFINLMTLNNKDQKLIYNIFQSLIYGDIESINNYYKIFINKAKDYIYRLGEYDNQLSLLLLHNTYLDIELTVYNKGKSTVIFYPYFNLKFLNERFSPQNIELEIYEIKNEVGEAMSNYADTYIKEMVGLLNSPDMITLNLKKDAYYSFGPVESIKSNSNSAKYLSITEGENKRILLRTIKPLNESGIKINDAIKTGLLECQISGLTVNHKIAHTSEKIIGVENKNYVLDKLQ